MKSSSIEAAGPARMDQLEVAAARHAQEVDKSRRAEASLREGERRFRRPVELAPDAVFLHGPDGRLVYVNDAAWLVVRSPPGDGTAVTVTIPVPPSSEGAVDGR